MIPQDQDELHALAGEYVLGVLAPDEVREIEAAMPTNAALSSAVTFWQEKLHPLAGRAPPGEPPPATWDKIASRIDGLTSTPKAVGVWNRPSLWRWSTLGFAAAAAVLVLYIAVTPLSHGPRYVAVLHAPQEEQADWIATSGRRGLVVRTVTGMTAPTGRAFELWVIGPGTAGPKSLGVIPSDGTLHVDSAPPSVRSGATLAISVEPPGGSPTKQPTGPVVFVGALSEL
ncbi:MAG TPA: anti-sigma factor [Acetobacteraceae bacterium]|nr:anti-sigma factor [Acetobacteraceae bacterium]